MHELFHSIDQICLPHHLTIKTQEGIHIGEILNEWEEELMLLEKCYRLS